jgi:hypothetical protein
VKVSQSGIYHDAAHPEEYLATAEDAETAGYGR